jgi:hypothetical protein
VEMPLNGDEGKEAAAGWGGHSEARGEGEGGLTRLQLGAAKAYAPSVQAPGGWASVPACYTNV